MASPQESRHSRFLKAVEGLKEGKYSVESLGKQQDGAFHWTVHNSNADYDVSYRKGKGWSCGCPDFEKRGKFLGMCKHTAMVFVASRLEDDLDAGIPFAEILDEGVAQALEQEFDEKFPIPKSIGKAPQAQTTQTPPPPPPPPHSNGNGNGRKAAQAKGNGNGHEQQSMPPMPPMPPAPRGNGNGNGHSKPSSKPTPATRSVHIEAEPAPVAENGKKSIITSTVVAQLEQPLDPKRIKVRKGPKNTRLSYIEGQDAIATANHIFGYGNWGYEVLSVDIDYGRKLVTALVRVSVKGAMPFTDVGTADIAGKEPLKPEAIQMAIKGAATDGVKRGLKNFGDQFGLGLYFDEGTSIQQPQRTPEEAFAEVFG